MIYNNELSVISETQLKELYFKTMGSTLLTDLLHTLLITLLAFTGFILNYISFETFRKIKFQNPVLKKYLQVYALASFIQCVLLMLTFLPMAPRITNISLTYLGSLIRCKILPWTLTNNFFLNTLDCIILLERITYFKNKLKKFSNINPYLLSSLLFITVNIINATNFLVESPRTDEEYVQILSIF